MWGVGGKRGVMNNPSRKRPSKGALGTDEKSVEISGKLVETSPNHCPFPQSGGVKTERSQKQK